MNPRHIWPAATFAIVVMTGCQTYVEQPLDLASHATAFDHRIVDLASIRSYAAHLDDDEAIVPASFAFDDGLTLAEAEVVALFYNARLRRERLAVGIARATMDHAGQWDDPIFGFDGAEIMSPSQPFQLGLRLDFTIPVSGRLDVERDRATSAHDAALRSVAHAEWTVRITVRDAWTNWTLAEQHLALHREMVAQIESIAGTAARLESAGELSRVEARLFRVELAERRVAMLEAEHAAYRSRMHVTNLIGLPPNAEVDLVPSLAMATPPPVDDESRRIIECNTALAVQRAAYQVAEDTLRLEMRKQYPDITFGAGYGSENNDDRLLLGVSLPIPVFNRNQAGIAEAEAMRSYARAQAETTYERLLHEIARAHADRSAARAQWTRFESDVIPMLDEQAADVIRIAELGDVDTLILLTTVERHFEVRSRLLELKREEVRAALEVIRHRGPDQPHQTATHSRAPSESDASTTNGAEQ
ncbi:MAG: TolC family protein [Planctomycetota bacterium]